MNNTTAFLPTFEITMVHDIAVPQDDENIEVILGDGNN
jgi:hypothetical protein